MRVDLRTYAHPLRIPIVLACAEEPMSPNRIAVQLGLPCSNVAYHVRQLERRGALRAHHQSTVRGALEHFYVATERGRSDAELLSGALGSTDA